MVLTYVNSILSKIPLFIHSIELKKKKITLNFFVSELFFLFNFLKKHTFCQYHFLMDITAVDYITKNNRFELIYQILSIRYNNRLLCKTSVSEINSVYSLDSLYKSSGWLEREIWDMFGIFFFYNKDLRRILTDYGFSGFPLRKDFPISGFLEIRYDDDIKRVFYDDVELSQEFRFFNFSSPWYWNV